MNFIQVRRFSTKYPIPPALSVKQAGTSAVQGARFAKLVDFHQRIPKGPRVDPVPTSLAGKYKAKYFETGSPAPILHVILALGLIGYTIDYNLHLSEYLHRRKACECKCDGICQIAC